MISCSAAKMAAGSPEMAQNGSAQRFRALVKRGEGAKMAAGHPEASLNGEYLAHLERIKHGLMHSKWAKYSPFNEASGWPAAIFAPSPHLTRA